MRPPIASTWSARGCSRRCWLEHMRLIDPGDGVGHEPDGARLEAVVGRGRASRRRPGLDAKLPPIVAGVDDRRHARAVLAATLRPSRRAGRRLVRRQPVQPRSARVWCAKGRVAISLGTSDTIFGLMRDAARRARRAPGTCSASPTGDVHGHDRLQERLARARAGPRRVRHRSGPAFSQALRADAGRQRRRMLLPWFEPEITPPVLTPGVQRLRPRRSTIGHGATSAAIVEAQMMALALHSRWMDVRIGTIYATGGASANRDVLQVHGRTSSTPRSSSSQTGNSAALGAALRAVSRRPSGRRRARSPGTMWCRDSWRRRSTRACRRNRAQRRTSIDA